MQKGVTGRAVNKRTGWLVGTLLAVATCLTWSVGTAQARTLYSNTSQDVSSQRTESQVTAVSVRTGTNQAGYRLDGIDLKLTVEEGETGRLAVSVREQDSDGDPKQTALYQLSAPASLQTGLNDFEATSSMELEAETSYWIVVEYLDESGPELDMTQSTSGDTIAAGWSRTNGHASYDSTSMEWTEESSYGHMIRIRGNSKANGTVEISGTPRIKHKLTARGVAVTDEDGLGDPLLPIWVWFRENTDGTGQEAAQVTGENEYTLVEEDIGKKIVVTMSFDDREGQGERITSEPYPGGSDTIEQGVPELVSASVVNNRVTLIYDEVLDGSKVPAGSAFTVKVNGTADILSFQDQIQIGGRLVRINLSGNVVSAGDTVTLDYAVPSTNALQNAEGGKADAISGRTLTNQSYTVPLTGILINNDLGGSSQFEIGHGNLAQSFRTGENANGYWLERIAIRIASGNHTGRKMTVRLRYNSQHNNPTGELATLASGVEPRNGKMEFQVPRHVWLEPDTRYWIYINVEGGTGKPSIVMSDKTTNGHDDWSIIDNMFSWVNGVGTWWDQRQMRITVRGRKAAVGKPRLLEIERHSQSQPSNEEYEVGDDIRILAKFDQQVEVDGWINVKIRVGNEERRAAYYARWSDEKVLEFRYTVRDEDSDLDGYSIPNNPVNTDRGRITRKGSEVEAYVNAQGLSDDANYRVNLMPVDDFRMTSEARYFRTYTIGEVMRVRARYDEQIEVEGEPYVRVCMNDRNSDCNEKRFEYERIRGNEREVTFTYTVQEGDGDNNGIWIGKESVKVDEQNYIREKSGNRRYANSNTRDIGPIESHRVWHGPVVKAIRVLGPEAGGDTFRLGEAIIVQVEFTKAVNVEGSPGFWISINETGDTGTNGVAEYVRGSGTNTLEFEYVVVEGDMDNNGIWLGDSSRTFQIESGDSIADADSAVAASLYHRGQGTLSDRKVDATLARLMAVTVEAEKDTVEEGDDAVFKVHRSVAAGAVDIKLSVWESGDVSDDYTSSPTEVTVSLADGVAEGEVRVTTQADTVEERDSIITAALKEDPDDTYEIGREEEAQIRVAAREDRINPSLVTTDPIKVTLGKIRIRYDEMLDENSVPDADRYIVKVNGSQVSLAATDPVIIEGDEVILTTEDKLSQIESLTVQYTRAEEGQGAAVQDEAQNRAESFEERNAVVERVNLNIQGLTVSGSGGTQITLREDIEDGRQLYTAWVQSESSVTVTLTVDDENAMVSMEGDSDATTPKSASYSLNEGKNTIRFTVQTQGEGRRRDYELILLRNSEAVPSRGSDESIRFASNLTVHSFDLESGEEAHGYGFFIFSEVGGLSDNGITITGSGEGDVQDLVHIRK